jgi:SAM-dependent methyltransferase
MQDVFTRIYRNGDWSNGSGSGIAVQSTVAYRNFIQQFVSEQCPRRIVDLGCGDWQSTHLIDFGDASYLGIDVVDHIIVANQQTYGDRPNVRFECLDFFSSPLPEGDLCLIKDVFQHWSNDQVLTFLSRLTQYPLVLITTSPAKDDHNRDIVTGQTRPLSLLKSPFNVAGEVVLEYDASGWSKQTILLKS